MQTKTCTVKIRVNVGELRLPTGIAENLDCASDERNDHEETA